jgi:protein gp37
MADLFHADVPEEYIRRVFDTMVRADWHTYQILTKRPQRLARIGQLLPWPPHIWIGVSVESNDYAWRADYLRRVPAAVRFVSAEPLLGPVNELILQDLDWDITGGERGAGHRRCDPELVRDVRDRCISEGAAFFHKQYGGRTPKAGGRLLDGRTWDELPSQSRLQEQTLSLR